MKVALDTSAWVQFRKNEPQVVRRIQRATLVCFPCTAIGELEAAFHKGKRVAENQAVLDAFLAEPLVEELPTTRAVARTYGVLFSKLRNAGTPIPINDVWIAAAAMDAQARLITFDRDFSMIAGLDVELLKAA